MILHALQLAISINLELVIYLWYIVYLPIRVGNNSVINSKIRAMPWLRNIQQLNLLTLHWRSFSGWGREPLPLVFASTGCQYLINGCLQPIKRWITLDAKLKIVDTPLTLILTMRQGACCCGFSKYRLPSSDKWISATNLRINDPRCEDKNRRPSIDAHSQDAGESMSL